MMTIEDRQSVLEIMLARDTYDEAFRTKWKWIGYRSDITSGLTLTLFAMSISACLNHSWWSLVGVPFFLALLFVYVRVTKIVLLWTTRADQSLEQYLQILQKTLSSEIVDLTS